MTIKTRQIGPCFAAEVDGVDITKPLSPDDVVAIMVGDLQRIRCYPAKGFQIHQDIPDDVWRAYEELVKAGYDKYLI